MMNLKLAAMSVILSSYAVFGQGWDGSNNPSKIGGVIEYQLANLPTKADISENTGIGWSGSFWPSAKGGIANRWNNPIPMDFKYVSPTLAQIKNMTQEEINQLSPAEKYDIFQGKYNYPLTKRVLATTKRSKKHDWAGICDGWSMASLNLVEPKPVTVTNADGITIGFGTSDVDALISHYYAYGAKLEGYQIGRRCFVKMANLNKGCKDMNAGSFHVAITNMIGLRKTGFVADVDRTKEVWNQPILGYEFEEMESFLPMISESANGIAGKALIRMKMIYADELQEVPGAPDNEFEDFKTWFPVTGTPHNERGERIYEYTLDLNSKGEIIGGGWLTWDRPDFMWFKKPDNDFKGEYADIHKIYQPIEL